jgi:hypothetical protein
MRVSRFVLPLALLGAPLAAVAAPAAAERVLRGALVVVAAALVADLVAAMARVLPPDLGGELRPSRPRAQQPPLPAGLVELDRDVRLLSMERLSRGRPRPTRLRAVAADTARSRMARRGLDLDDPADLERSRALLTTDVHAYVVGAAASVDARELAGTLESL